MDGQYPRLNGEMVKRGDGSDSVFSVIGEMKSCTGEQLVLEAADGKTLKYNISPDFRYEEGQKVEIMGSLNSENGVLDAFIQRDLGADFDLNLYNDLITKVYKKHSKYFL